jgi:hypothetical protein
LNKTDTSVLTKSHTATRTAVDGSQTAARTTGLTVIGVAACCGIGAVFALYHLGTKPYRLDEAASVSGARLGHSHQESRGPDAVGREDALRLLAELGDVQGRLDDLKRRLRELADGA